METAGCRYFHCFFNHMLIRLYILVKLNHGPVPLVALFENRGLGRIGRISSQHRRTHRPLGGRDIRPTARHDGGMDGGTHRTAVFGGRYVDGASADIGHHLHHERRLLGHAAAGDEVIDRNPILGQVVQDGTGGEAGGFHDGVVKFRRGREKLQALPLTIIGTRPIDEAIITRGGVDVKGVSPNTMESKAVKGLYFAGEVLDVDAHTGGYNLQIAWSTGALAGKSAAEAVLEEAP